MKLSEMWLREWINPALTREELCTRLTMAGLEIESITPVAHSFSGVVVATVLHVEKHPEADRLQVCKVDIGKPEHLTIVCGAKNVTPGMKTAAALDGAMLSDNKIKNTKLRGVLSQGMLCSARELGLTDDSEGLIVLSPDAPVGELVWDYLMLADHVIDVSITPNRGDCLSMLGLAHELHALTEAPIIFPATPNTNANIPDSLSIAIHEPLACPRYVGRIVRQIKADTLTPIWMQERLRRAGIRRIHIAVDIMNYVMLELGQPMHAFDAAKIAGDIQVRLAKPDETLLLLDKQTVTLDSATLVIADQEKPLAIAGVMGGFDSGVTLSTQDVFLESAFFQPTHIVRTARHYALTSDSSYRFERGVDPDLQIRALERATQLLLEIAGGQPGPIVDVKKIISEPRTIYLRTASVKKLLGITLPDTEIIAILTRLGCQCAEATAGWNVTVPLRRFDLAIEEDLIEEIARVYGYDAIPLNDPHVPMQLHARTEKQIYLPTIRRTLNTLGYQEVITYSFIDNELQTLFDPNIAPKKLLNPISSEMAVMRTSLWPGLVTTLLYNQNRQQPRVRLIEVGLRFIQDEQQKVLSGLISGSSLPEQWGAPLREVDFFDLKGDLENVFKLTFEADTFTFKPARYPALHPGQAADIYRGENLIGRMGALHPSIIQTLDIPGRVFVFELKLDALEIAAVPSFTEISKFPEIRRDIALIVDQAIPAQTIQTKVSEVGGELVKNVMIFDVYQGKGIEPGRKSLALALTLQHAERTLVDKEVADIIERVIVALRDLFAAELRG